MLISNTNIFPRLISLLEFSAADRARRGINDKRELGIHASFSHRRSQNKNDYLRNTIAMGSRGYTNDEQSQQGNDAFRDSLESENLPDQQALNFDNGEDVLDLHQRYFSSKENKLLDLKLFSRLLFSQTEKLLGHSHHPVAFHPLNFPLCLMNATMKTRT